MSNFIKNTLAMVIIGDEENKEFDGKIKMNGKNEYIRYHCDSIKRIIKELDNEGYSLESINYSSFHESAFGLVNLGHILFCNCTMASNTFGYLFLPNKITSKQVESLKLFESNFQKFQELYIMKVDEIDNQNFTTRLSCYDFNVDQLTDTYYKKKTK